MIAVEYVVRLGRINAFPQIRHWQPGRIHGRNRLDIGAEIDQGLDAFHRNFVVVRQIDSLDFVDLGTVFDDVQDAIFPQKRLAGQIQKTTVRASQVSLESPHNQPNTVRPLNRGRIVEHVADQAAGKARDIFN